MTKIRIKKTGGYTYIYEGKTKVASKNRKGRKTGATRYFKYLDMPIGYFRHYKKRLKEVV
jgi:hypothetical protein